MYDILVALYGKNFELFFDKEDVVLHFIDWYDTPLGDSISFENERIIETSHFIDELKELYLRR